MNSRGSALACSEPRRARLLSTDEITRRVIAAKGFDARDVILRAAIREQVGSTVKRLHRDGAVDNVGAGRASRRSLTDL
jgi:hypothetical protein